MSMFALTDVAPDQEVVLHDSIVLLILGTILICLILGVAMLIALGRRRRLRQHVPAPTREEVALKDPWAVAADRIEPFEDTGADRRN